MKVHCVSVNNPDSYLLCAGVKDVENFQFNTDYRGAVYIHSGGRYSILGVPDFTDYPLPVMHEFNDLMDKVAKLDRGAKYVGFPERGVRVLLKNEESQPTRRVLEYNLLSDIYQHYRKEPTKPFFLNNAIIGKAELVDVVTNSPSEWARADAFNWIFQNAVRFSEPVLDVMAGEHLWEYEL
jgi:hypothetical protein